MKKMDWTEKKKKEEVLKAAKQYLSLHGAVSPASLLCSTGLGGWQGE